eukprot:366513-Chlamydomonas_euryale.AAC.3
MGGQKISSKSWKPGACLSPRQRRFDHAVKIDVLTDQTTDHAAGIDVVTEQTIARRAGADMCVVGG